MYGNRGKIDLSISALEKSLEICQNHYPDRYTKIAELQALMGNTQIRTNYHRAKTLLESSLKIYNEHLPYDYTNLAWIHLFLGYAEESQGHFLQAREFFVQSLHICQNNLPNKPIKRAWAMANIGNMSQELGEYDHAEKNLQESLKLCHENLSYQHRGFAILRGYCGFLESVYGSQQKAGEILGEVGAFFEKFYPEPYHWHAWILTGKGILKREQNDFKAAKVSFKQALEIYQKSYAYNHPRIGELKKELGTIYLLEESFDKSQGLFCDSLSILESIDHSYVPLIKESLSEIYAKKANASLSSLDQEEQLTLAKTYINESYSMAEEIFPQTSIHFLRIKSKYDKLFSLGNTF